jgi:hypothetical protein
MYLYIIEWGITVWPCIMHLNVVTQLMPLVSISLPTLEYLPASNQVTVWSGTAKRCIESCHTQLNHKHNADRLVFAVSQG